MAKLSRFLRREWLSLILGGILGALACGCVYGPLGPHDLLLLRHHREKLTLERDRLMADDTQLTKRIARLRSDDAYLQRVIRQELGYVRPGELVYRFAPESQ